jgi:hypothetical protein
MNLKKELTYPFAKNSNGELIFIEEVEGKGKFSCWGCNQPMYPRLGKIRIHHFYHRSKTCSFESALHYAFKWALFDRIIKGINNNKDLTKDKVKLIIQWNCAKCDKDPKGDLLKRIDNAELEKNVDKYRPDVKLFRKDGSIYAVIEIEYTSPLKDKPRQHYIEKKIGIIEFKPKEFNDLKAIYNNPIIPNACNLCGHQIEKEIITKDSMVKNQSEMVQ